MRRAVHRSLLALFAALGITLASSTAANAHYVYYADLVWSNADSSRCVMNRSETSHGSTGGGYFHGDSMSQAELSSIPSDCILPWERNTGWLAEGFVIYKWYVDAQGDGSWLICDRTDQWYMNSEPASTMRITSTAPAGGACGSGYYGLGNYAGMKDGNAWYGWDVMMWSGSHLLPDTSFAAPPAPTEAPPGVNDDNVAPAGSMPDTMPVSDSNGKPALDASGNLIETQVLPEAPTGAKSLAAANAPRHFTTAPNGATIEEVEVVLDGLVR
ncbi:hypothetical protein ACN6LI_007374 [Streptomyces violaceoruber]